MRLTRECFDGSAVAFEIVENKQLRHLDRGMNSELLENAATVEFDRAAGNRKLFRDIYAAMACADELRDLNLSIRQPLVATWMEAQRCARECLSQAVTGIWNSANASREGFDQLGAVCIRMQQS